MSAAIVLLALLAAPASGRPSEGFRDHHALVKQHLAHVAEWTGQLSRPARAADKRRAGEKVFAFFDQHIRPHAEWEEKSLYPLIDRLAGPGDANRFTATMRYEHRVVGRWIGDLAAELEKQKPDYAAFARRSDNLLGLLQAHFEEEEEVLLPVADAKLTRAQFEAEVGPPQ